MTPCLPRVIPPALFLLSREEFFATALEFTGRISDLIKTLLLKGLLFLMSGRVPLSLPMPNLIQECFYVNRHDPPNQQSLVPKPSSQ